MKDHQAALPRLDVSSAALERTSLLRWLPASQQAASATGASRQLLHASEAGSGQGEVFHRGASNIVSLQAERRAFALAARFADLACTEALRSADDGTRVLLLRHPEASRFLLMNDLVGLLRPLVDVQCLTPPDGRVKLPRGEIIARGALRELAALDVPATDRVLQHRPTQSHGGKTCLHLVDAASPFHTPRHIKPDIVLDPRHSGPTARSLPDLVRSYRILRRSGSGPYLGMLLAHGLHRFLSQRLSLFASFELDQTDLSPDPVVYWSNMSLRSVFHASERRARGLPTIAVHSILMDPSERYFCDVFDAVVSLGTGQGAAVGAAARAQQLAPQLPPQAPTERILMALQPSEDIMRQLVDFARLAVSAGYTVLARPHPVHRRNRALLGYWRQKMDVELDDRTGTDLAGISLVVTGTSNFAAEACWHGVPALLLCGDQEARRLWPDCPAPGHILPADVPASADPVWFRSLFAQAKAAMHAHVAFHERLPGLEQLI